MATALSMDLRIRVLSEVDADASCRQATRRFGVSAASAIRWNALRRREGHVRPQRHGGDRRSHRIEAHAQTIFGVLGMKRDMTLPEMKAVLAEKGLAVIVLTFIEAALRAGSREVARGGTCGGQAGKPAGGLFAQRAAA
jgi:transposase